MHGALCFEPAGICYIIIADAANANSPDSNPIAIRIIVSPAMLMMNPAIANPRGDLKMPITENRNPKIHNIQAATGIQHPIIAKIARMNPAVPMLLQRRHSTTMGGCL